MLWFVTKSIPSRLYSSVYCVHKYFYRPCTYYSVNYVHMYILTKNAWRVAGDSVVIDQ